MFQQIEKAIKNIVVTTNSLVTILHKIAQLCNFAEN